MKDVLFLQVNMITFYVDMIKLSPSSQSGLMMLKIFYDLVSSQHWIEEETIKRREMSQEKTSKLSLKKSLKFAIIQVENYKMNRDA